MQVMYTTHKTISVIITIALLDTRFSDKMYLKFYLSIHL